MTNIDKYLKHTHDCMTRNNTSCDDIPCTCGLEQAVKELTSLRDIAGKMAEALQDTLMMVEFSDTKLADEALKLYNQNKK